MFLFHMFRFISPAALPSSELLELGGSPGLSQVGAGVTVGAAGAVVCAWTVLVRAKAAARATTNEAASGEVGTGTHDDGS